MILVFYDSSLVGVGEFPLSVDGGVVLIVKPQSLSLCPPSVSSSSLPFASSSLLAPAPGGGGRGALLPSSPGGRGGSLI